MIACLVRARNDLGDLGFLRKAKRLNVILSRQRKGLVIVGDLDCILATPRIVSNPVPIEQAAEEDGKALGSQAEEQTDVELDDAPL